MTTSEKLKHQLEEVLSGEPWYGPSVYSVIDSVSFEAAYEKPPGSVHNIADIVMHMISWTEETIDRMNGLPSGAPTSGDWPQTGSPDEQKWQNYVEDLKLVNVNLTGIIQKFPEEQWSEHTIDDRYNDEGIGDTYQELIIGLIQHHIYHLGQIALLKRILGLS